MKKKQLTPILAIIALVIAYLLGFVEDFEGLKEPGPRTSKTEIQRPPLSGSSSHFFKGKPRLIDPKIPFNRGQTKIISHKGYVLEHCSELKNAAWVCERVTAQQLEGSYERDDDFKPEPQLSKGERAELKDYARSGYDRGHLAAAGNQNSDPELKQETFYLSNMAPQKPDFNRGIWKSIESFARKQVKKYGECWFITGGFYFEDSEEKGSGNGRIRIKRIGKGVAVPSHFFKIIIRQSQSGPKTLCFVVRNRDYNAPYKLDQFIKPVSWVEKWAGIDFMPELSRQSSDQIEGRKGRLTKTKKSGFQWSP